MNFRHAFFRSSFLCFTVAVLLLCTLATNPTHADAKTRITTYTNPLSIVYTRHGKVENCPDPTIIHSQQVADTAWYVYCTQTPLNAKDVTKGIPHFHLIPILKSLDLVHWLYVSDVFSTPPSWADPTTQLQAPKIVFANNLYYLYYTVTDVADAVSNEPNCHSDNAIGVATSTSPTGPWTEHGSPVVAPRRGQPTGCQFYPTGDPSITDDGAGQQYIYFGTLLGGIQVETLSADGFTADLGSLTPITISSRYESAEVIKHSTFWYLFVSTFGSTVFVGRASSPTGPFLDNTGAALMDNRVGGTPVLSVNGSRWMSLRHSTVFTDFAGQDWFLYNAIDSKDTAGRGAANFFQCYPIKCRLMMDRLDWISGWPTVRDGSGTSTTAQPAPAGQPGVNNPQPLIPPLNDTPGALIPTLSDEFTSPTMLPQWSWLRPPSASTFGLDGNSFRFDTQAGDLYLTNNTASSLLEATPKGNYLVETKLTFNLPADASNHDYSQAGLVIYANDNSYIKLNHISIAETRQTEFAKESTDRGGFYGSAYGEAPADVTYLRIAKRVVKGQELYTGYTSTDGTNFVRAGTWAAKLGSKAHIGLVSMGGVGLTANFDYVRVYKLAG